MRYLKYFQNYYNVSDLDLDDEEWSEPHNKDILDKRKAQTVQFMNSLKVGDYLVYYWDYQPVDYSVDSRTVPHLIRLTRSGDTHKDWDTGEFYPIFHYRELSDYFREGDPDKKFDGWDAYVQNVVCITRNKEEAWKVYNELLPPNE